MAKILIAAVETGAAFLGPILEAQHDLKYAKTVEQVLELAKTMSFDLLIVGVLFDYSRMYDLIRAAKSSEELMGVPVMGFSDELTDMTVSGRDTLETVMHIMGASDYVDTRDMNADEIRERVEACLVERKPVKRNVQSSEPTPAAKRRSQEIVRWKNRLLNAASRKPYSLATVGDEESAAQLQIKLNGVSGVRFKIINCASIKSLLIAISHTTFDAVLASVRTVQFNDGDYKHLEQLAPNLPLFFLGENSDNRQRSVNFIEIPEAADGLSIALSILNSIEKNSRDSNYDSAIAKFLLTCLRQSATALGDGKSSDRVLSDFCLSVEQYAKSQHDSDVAVSIMLLDKDGINLSCGAGPSLPEKYQRAIAHVAVAPNSGSCGTAAYLKESVFVTDIKKDARWADFRDAALEHSLAACWSVPIFDESGELVGTFAIYNRTPREPNNVELDLIGALSSIASALLVQVELRDAVPS